MMKSFTSTSIRRQQHVNLAAPPSSNGPTKADLQVVRQIDHYMGKFGKVEQDAFRKEMEADFGKDWYYANTVTAPKATPTPTGTPKATKKSYISFGSRDRRLRSDKKVKSRNSIKRKSPFPEIISIPTDATMTIPSQTTTLEYERKNIFYLQAEKPCRATSMFSGKMLGVLDRKTRHHKRTATLSTTTTGTLSFTKCFINDKDCVTPDEPMGYFTKDDIADGDDDGWASVMESDISESDYDDDDDDDTVFEAPATPMPKVAAHKTAPTTTGRVGRVAAWLFPKKAVRSPPATMPEFHSGPNHHRIRKVKRNRRFRYSSFQDQAKNHV